MLRHIGGLKAQALHLGILAVVLGHRDREVQGLINVVTDSELQCAGGKGPDLHPRPGWDSPGGE